MNIGGKHLQSIWFDKDLAVVKIIDQTKLPHELVIASLTTLDESCYAIESMQVRGAPLIGVAAAYGVYLAMVDEAQGLQYALDKLAATRPTAVNLQWALSRMEEALLNVPEDQRARVAFDLAQTLEQEDIEICAAIGANGADLLQKLWEEKRATQTKLNVLTHCNAGALATVDWGTALAVIYKAIERNIPLHVWVDETRPRNQGAALTCWELAQEGIAHTLIVDNAGGHLMQHGQVDVCIVGSDRTTLNGDVCNKIGTYLKALAAKDNQIPFYVALPVSSIDFSISDGLREIPIEERSALEVTHVTGVKDTGELATIRLSPEGVTASNYGFDVTPANLVSFLITERGVVKAKKSEIASLKK